MAVTKRNSPAERPAQGQILAQTLLLALAFAPLMALLEPQVSAYFYFVLAARALSVHWPQLAPGRWLLVPFTLAGGINVYDAYHTIAGPEAGTALLATMMALKLLETRRVRDLWFGTLLFGFLLVAQFLVDQSPALTLYLGVLLVGNFALMADLCERAPRYPVRRSLGLAVRLVLQALPLTAVLFVLFPRLAAPLWAIDQGGARGVSGVKPLLEPGAVSELVLDETLAFRVRFEGNYPPPSQLYWRGPVLWQTDGRRWTPGATGSSAGPAAPLARAQGQVAYTLVVEPTGQRWLFPLDLPTRVDQGVRLTSDFQALTAKRIDAAGAYRMQSALSYDTGPGEAGLEAALQLPENVTERMRGQVSEWGRGTHDPQDVIRRALAWFNREPFYYTLRPPVLAGNPADEFLFETRRGFCEHYASSFALLMRIAGIPARVVVGYMGGERNPIGDYLMVRQSDAHAWVEVWLQGRGWVRVDPTASIAPERVERDAPFRDLAGGGSSRRGLEGVGLLARWLHGVSLLADAADEQWRLWVVGYSQARQLRLLASLGLESLGEYGLAAAMAIAAVAVVALLAVALGRGEMRRDALERLYQRFCRRLARTGLARRPSEGPLDFARRVEAVRPDLALPVRGFVELYTAMRYGDERGEASVRELRRRLAGVRPRRR
jgi:transglutaminase-like putative cysteine protease